MQYCKPKNMNILIVSQYDAEKYNKCRITKDLMTNLVLLFNNPKKAEVLMKENAKMKVCQKQISLYQTLIQKNSG